MNLQDLVSSLRVENATDLEARAKATAKLAELRGAEVKGEEVSGAKVEKLRSKKSEIDARVELRNARIVQLEADMRSDAAATKMSKELRATGAAKPAYDNVARVGREERTYHPGNDPKGKTFLADLAGSAVGAFGANDRLNRHMQEEMVERAGTRWAERATSTGSFVGLTVPQYLTDFYAPNAKAMKPFISAARQMDLPAQGMVVNISRITTGASADVQAPQNNAVSDQDLADTLLTIPVQTLAAQQVMSRQAIERSTGAEEVTLDDLMRTMYTKQDNLFINQAVTGATNRFNSVTYSTPGNVQAYAALLEARSNVESVLLDTQEGDQLAIMHSRRWASINSGSGTSFPFLSQQPNSRYLTAGEDAVANYGPGYRGNYAGLNVIVDNNIPTNLGGGTNQDEIYVVNRRECIVWEDPTAPVMIRAEQTNAASLGVLFVMYMYWAYTFDRYQSGGFSAHQKISGTGLVTPAFLGAGG
jgi:hypothetical protein